MDSEWDMIGQIPLTFLVLKKQYNSPRSLTLDITQNIFDSGKINYNLEKIGRGSFLQSRFIHPRTEYYFKAAKTYLNLYAAIEINKLAKIITLYFMNT